MKTSCSTENSPVTSNVKKRLVPLATNLIRDDYLIHRATLYVPKEEWFPIPLKYIYLTRNTRTQIWICVARKTYWWLLERRCAAKLVGFMDRIHEVHVVERKTSSRIDVVRGATYQDSSNNQTWLLWPQIWNGMSKSAKKKEKQEWWSENPKFDNAGRLRGIFFIDPEDAQEAPCRWQLLFASFRSRLIGCVDPS